MDFGKRSGDKRQSILSVGDDEYVQYSEFEFVASNLLSMAALHYSAKSGGETDVNAFASKFCSKLESCQHVLGAEYDYIRCSKIQVIRTKRILCFTQSDKRIYQTELTIVIDKRTNYYALA